MKNILNQVLQQLESNTAGTLNKSNKFSDKSLEGKNNAEWKKLLMQYPGLKEELDNGTINEQLVPGKKLVSDNSSSNNKMLLFPFTASLSHLLAKLQLGNVHKAADSQSKGKVNTANQKKAVIQNKSSKQGSAKDAELSDVMKGISTGKEKDIKKGKTNKSTIENGPTTESANGKDLKSTPKEVLKDEKVKDSQAKSGAEKAVTGNQKKTLKTEKSLPDPKIKNSQNGPVAVNKPVNMDSSVTVTSQGLDIQQKNIKTGSVSQKTEEKGKAALKGPHTKAVPDQKGATLKEMPASVKLPDEKGKAGSKKVVMKNSKGHKVKDNSSLHSENRSSQDHHVNGKPGEILKKTGTDVHEISKRISKHIDLGTKQVNKVSKQNKPVDKVEISNNKPNDQAQEASTLASSSRTTESQTSQKNSVQELISSHDGKTIKEPGRQTENQNQQNQNNGSQFSKAMNYQNAESVKQQLPAKIVQVIQKEVLAGKNMQMEQWQQHKFVMDDGKSLNVALKQNGGILHLQIGSQNADLSKLLQQQMHEIKMHLQDHFNLEIDLQLQNSGQQGQGTGRENTGQTNNSNQSNISSGGEIAGATSATSKQQSVRFLGFNRNEWTG
jgi:hypothetical protein